MSEDNVKKFFETLARIFSDREHVNVTVTVVKKNRGTEGGEVAI